MEPIDYTKGFSDPFAGALQGFQLGQQMQTQALNRELVQKQMQAQEALQAQALQKAQAEQQAAQRKAQFQQSVAGLFTKPTVTHADLVLLQQTYPEMLDDVNKAWTQISAPEQERLTNTLSSVYSALNNGNTAVATDIINQEVARAQNSGDATRIQQAETFKKMLDTPQGIETLKTSVGMALAPRLGKDFATAFKDISAAPAQARKAEIEAKYAESNAILDLKKKGWDIEAVKSSIDVAKENARIAAINSSIAREGNDLKRQELRLKVDEAISARDQKIRDKVAEAESARSTMDNMLSNADRILSMAVGKDGKPTSTLRAAAGTVDARMPTLQSDVADLEALVETLGSQAFLSQIPSMKNTGSLTEREGDKLQASLTNLSLKQSPEQLVKNIQEAQRLITKARKNVTIRYGIPETEQDRPYLEVTKDEVDSLLKQYGGK